MNKLNYDLNFRYKLEDDILGSIMIDGGLEMKELLLKHQLEPNDFRKTYHKELYETILKIWNDNKKVDLLTLTQYRPSQYRKNGLYSDSKLWDFKNIELIEKHVSSAFIEERIMKFKEYIIIQYWNNVSDYIADINWEEKDILQVSSNLIKRYNQIWRRLTEKIKNK